MASHETIAMILRAGKPEDAGAIAALIASIQSNQAAIAT